MKYSLTAIIISLTLASSSWAFNTGFLGDTPWAKFSPQDKRKLTESIGKALAEGGDGQTIDWKNETSGASGAITPQKTFERGGRKCRELEIQNRYKTLKGQGLYTFCQDQAGKWRLAP